jgi:hypothetical protein
VKPKKSRRVSGRAGSTSPNPTPGSRRPRAGGTRRDAALSEELRALRLDAERTAGHLKDVVQKVDRLILVVGELRETVTDLQAALGEGDAEYGAVDETDSEMGEGHA